MKKMSLLKAITIYAPTRASVEVLRRKQRRRRRRSRKGTVVEVAKPLPLVQ
jgi:uncharacterized protein (DUF2062 family)